jgi:hypothetical protein
MREEELFGKIYLIVTYDPTNQSLKVRLKKLKCYSREYFQSGLYVRYFLSGLYFRYFLSRLYLRYFQSGLN